MRPQFHFTAPRGWINDPHGILWHEGRYHAFYQAVPHSTDWAPGCSWGHATGPDLLSLEAGPVALEPGDGDEGVWTGSLVVDEAGTATILYTSVLADALDAGRIRVARPLDAEWLRWEKGPVVLTPPPDLDLVAYRDPFVVRDGEGWRMLVGGGLRDGTALALGYRSPDLERWELEGIFAQRSSADTAGAWTGAVWECPQLVEIDGRSVLITSVWAEGVLYWTGYGVGHLVDGRFTAERWGRLSFGSSHYAPSFYRDPDGRGCLLFWMRGVRDEAERWSGAHSIPYLLALDGDRLIASPHPDLERYLAPAIAVGPGARVAPAAQLRWRPAPGDELRLFEGDDEDAAAVLTVVLEEGGVAVSGRDGAEGMPWSGGELRIVLDGPVAEIVAADGVLGCSIPSSGAALTLGLSGPKPELRELHRG